MNGRLLKLAAVFAALYLPAALAQVRAPLPPCDSGGRYQCGVVNPEDLSWSAALGGLVVSEFGREDTAGRISFFGIDADAPRLISIASVASPETAWACGGPPEHPIEPRGHALIPGFARGPTLLVINGGVSPDRVERLALSRPGSGGVVEATWEGCLEVPEELYLNDLAGFTDRRGVIASHMFSRSRLREDPEGLQRDLKSGRATGYLAEWRPEEGWRAVPGSHGPFPNGVALAEDGVTAYVAETYGSSLTVLDLTDTKPARRIPLPHRPDNLSLTGRGRILVAGSTLEDPTELARCREPDGWPCGFPFSVALVDPAPGFVSVLLVNPDARWPGASVAVRVAGRLALGTAFGDRIVWAGLPEGL